MTPAAIDRHWRHVRALARVAPDPIYRVHPSAPILRERGFRHDVAIHEAGHAVCRLALDLPVFAVAVDDDGSGYVAGGPDTRRPTLDDPLPDPQPFNELAAAQCSISLAGLLAEALATCAEIPRHWLLWDFAGTDHRTAGALATTTAQRWACQQAAAQILADRWHHVEAIADALAHHGRIDARQLAELTDEPLPAAAIR